MQAKDTVPGKTGDSTVVNCRNVKLRVMVTQYVLSYSLYIVPTWLSDVGRIKQKLKAVETHLNTNLKQGSHLRIQDHLNG